MPKDTKNCVSAPIQTRAEQAKAFKQIKEKHWIVYYYLLSLSNYNNEEKDNPHRYVYREDFNLSSAARGLGIGRSTFYTALERLEKAGLIKQSSDKRYYILPIKSGWASISKKLLNALLGYSNALSVDLLRTYLFICAYEAEFGRGRGFTRRNIVRCLGHSETDTLAYQRLDIYLSLLEQWKLVYLDEDCVQDDLGTHKIYYVIKIEKESQILDSFLENRINESKNVYGLSKEEEEIIKNNI